MFMTFVNILLICTLIAELMLMTVMVLAQTRVEFALMIPLIVATLLFNVYIRQKHFYVTHFLSSKSCVELDNQNEYHRKHDNDFLSNKYVQPALLPAFDRVDLNTFFLGLVHYDSKNKKVDADV